eukprot:scaffold271098_cov27-Tisochrysis_lutea.AAC.2
MPSLEAALAVGASPGTHGEPKLGCRILCAPSAQDPGAECPPGANHSSAGRLGEKGGLTGEGSKARLRAVLVSPPPSGCEAGVWRAPAPYAGVLQPATHTRGGLVRAHAQSQLTPGGAVHLALEAACGWRRLGVHHDVRCPAGAIEGRAGATRQCTHHARSKGCEASTSRGGHHRGYRVERDAERPGALAFGRASRGHRGEPGKVRRARVGYNGGRHCSRQGRKERGEPGLQGAWLHAAHARLSLRRRGRLERQRRATSEW